MKILVVEDDPVLSDLLRDYLQRLDHEIVQMCLTAHEALGVIGSEVYDCAFIDLKLPDMNGLALLEIIKAQDLGLPIVMMSGYATIDYTIEAMRRGASDFLTKPFTLQDMALALERVTKERRLLLENLSLKLECQARAQLEVVNQELAEKIDEQVKLFAVSEHIDGIRSSEDLYPCIVELASRLTAAGQVGFFILPPDQDKLFLISEHGMVGHSQSCSRVLPVSDGCLKKKLSSDVGPVVMRPDELSDDPQLRNWVSDGALLSCWPLFIRGELFGFLTTSHNGQRKAPSQAETKLLDFLMKKSALAVENMALYESMIGNFYGILKSLVNALEAKDLYTGRHSERVTKYALDIALRMRCSVSEIESLQTVGYLHDIGKIGLADSILNKPGPLTREEFEMVKRHPSVGEAIVSELGLSPDERAIIRHHHERWDGRGYPDGLARNDIPLLARIVMVADAFDAMTSKRAYRDAMSSAAAIEELRKNRDSQFDSEVVDTFLEAMATPESEEEHAGTGLLAG